MLQLCLFETVKSPKKDKNRDAKWDKFYTLYMFDEIKYHQILKEYIDKHNLKTYKEINPNELKDLKMQCYIRDEDDGLKLLGDEKHIFRYQTLHKIYAEIGKIVTKNIIFNDDCIYKENGLIISVSYYTKGSKSECEILAEIDGTWDLSLKERILLHLKLLRKLRKKELTISF